MSSNAFYIEGNTVAMAVTATVHATVLVPGVGAADINYVLTNIGPNTVYIAYAGPVNGVAPVVTAAIPVDGIPALGYPVLALSKETITAPPNAYFSAICAATNTATLYISPGTGE